MFRDEKGSLKRTLVSKYPGAKSVLDAFEQEIKSRQNLLPAGTPSEYEIFVDAINQITVSFEGIDFNSLDSRIIEQINKIPLDSASNVSLWREAWLELLKKQRVFEKQVSSPENKRIPLKT